MTKWIPPTTACVCIATIETVALTQGINGSTFAASIAAIVAVIAYYFGRRFSQDKL
jgi:hypothetical protein